jgi:hypothetical protein
MNETRFFAVFLHPQALEVLGETVKPYLRAGPPDVHLLVNEVDTSGPYLNCWLPGQDPQGKEIEIELLIPHGFVRLVMSVRSEQEFGFAG